MNEILSRGIEDMRVIHAMHEVPRERFLPAGQELRASANTALDIGEGQTIAEPLVVALMTAALELKAGDKVLEVGTGSGYQAAILAEIVGKRGLGRIGHVYTIERIPLLAERSKELLSKLGYGNISVITGDGSIGLPEKAPFDAIIVTAGGPGVHKSLIKQLVDGGRFVIPFGRGTHNMSLAIGTRHGDDVEFQKIDGFGFVPLIGEYGFPEGFEG